MRLFVLLCTLASLCTAQTLYADQNPEVSQKTGLGHIREARQAQQPNNYRPYSQAPAQIKNLLQFQQAREPIVNIPPQPVPQLTPGRGQQGGPQVQTTAQATAYRPNVQIGQAPQQPTYNRAPQQPAYNPQQPAYNTVPQQPAYAPQQPAYRPLPQQAAAPAYNPQYQPQAAAYNPQLRQGAGQQQQQQPNYRAAYQPIPGPQAEQSPNYSKNIPPAIQQLIQAQQNQQG